MSTTNELLYYIPAGQYGKEGVLALLEQHPEIKFVSLVGIDLAGNDTDEKIPMSAFFDDYESFFEGRAVQTDGSSVVLTNIATLNNARVDMWGDPSVNWFVDYNYENIDPVTGLPTGTLRIPAFLMHNYRYVDSRSILKRSCDYVRAELLALIKEHGLPGMPHVKADEVVDIIFTSATELEFWVKTPSRTVTKKELSVSQKLQEQYWQRTPGTVRTALALIFVSAFDGMKYAITSGKTQAQLLAEISKEVGESADYLDTNRAYRTEKDVFDDFTQEERNQMFGVAPATVWENVKGYYNNPELVETLSQGDAFAKDLMESFIASILKRWKLVLANRLIPNNLDTVRNMVAIHTDSRNSVDDKRFAEVNDLRFYLAKDSDDRKSLFTRLTEALHEGDYDLASKLQIEMNDKMEELEAKYANYAKNIF